MAARSNRRLPSVERRFFLAKENWLICGPTGVGKSRLVIAIGYEAIKRDMRVPSYPALRLLMELFAARADGSYPRLMHKIITADLLILDDFGLRPITAQGAEDLYEVIHQRYERGSIILTSNRSPSEWPELFGDSLLVSAALDRLTHHARVTIITGKSCRQKERRKGSRKAEEKPEITEGWITIYKRHAQKEWYSHAGRSHGTNVPTLDICPAPSCSRGVRQTEIGVRFGPE